MRHRVIPLDSCLRRGLLVAVLGAAASFAGAGEPIVATDLLRMRSVASIDVSGDGSSAVLSVRSIGIEPVENDDGDENGNIAIEYRNRAHLYLLDLKRADDGLRRLTFGARSDASPQIAPDGSAVAFVRRAGGPSEDDNGQVWIMPLDGGEARPVTDLPLGASDPRWSPDGRRLLVSGRVAIEDLEGAPPWPVERPGRAFGDAADAGVTPAPDGTREEIRAWLAANAAERDPDVITRMAFQSERRVRGPMRFEHLFIVDMESDDFATRRITDGFFDHEEARFMPDGKQVVYVSRRPAEVHPDRVLESALWLEEIDGERAYPLLSRPGWRSGAPRPSIDGSVIAFTGNQTDEPIFRRNQLGLVTVAEGDAAQTAWLTEPATFDANVGAVEWMEARSALIFNAPIEGAIPLLRMSQGLLEPALVTGELDGFPESVSVFDVGGGAIVYAACSPARPCVVRVIDGRGDRTVADLNEWVADKDVSLPRMSWVSRPDGLRVQYWVMEPTNRRDGAKYPVCLQMHGGPGVMWGPGERSMWHELQLLCSWGYAVVYANPRGSDGYGYDFIRGNFQQWGEGPSGDVLAALDDAFRAHDFLDEDRQVLTGGSYAGYLTAWIVGHEQRFRAAVAQRGVYHFDTFFGEGNAFRLVEWAMGGFPWEARIRPILDRESPFTYVNRIRTPLLIMHGNDDRRAGVAQSEMMYRAMKALDRPVEYVRYPNAGHELSRTGDPTQRMDRLNRIIEFFERFVENERAAPRVGASD